MKVVANLFISCTKVVTWFFACCSSPLLSTSLVPPTIQLVNHGYGMQCKVCMQTFMCTAPEVKCREHAEAKHPKSDLYTCFPHLKKWQLICETRTLRFVLLARKCICYPSCYYLISFFMPKNFMTVWINCCCCCCTRFWIFGLWNSLAFLSWLLALLWNSSRK